MRRATEEQGLIIRPAVAAHSDDNAQPDVTEHPYRFRMLLAALPGTQVVGLGPLTMALAGECELPHRASQGMTTGPTNMYSADGRAFPGDRRGTGFALGAARIAISVAIVAQFSDHPGGEKVASAGQAVVELAVRMESQYPLNLPIVGLEVFGKRLQLGHQRARQSCLRADERRRDLKAAGLHLRVNLHCSVVAVGAVTAPEEGVEPCRRHRLQGLPRRKRLKQRQGDGPIGIREQGQELREIGFQARGELIAEHGAGVHQLGSIASQRPQLLSDLRVRQQGANSIRSVRSRFASTHASRRSDLAPATPNRSRCRSTAFGLMAYTVNCWSSSAPTSGPWEVSSATRTS